MPSRLHLPDRDMFTETTRLFACVLVVQWLAVVAFTYWMARTHVVAAFPGGVLGLIPMALAIVRGRGARQALAERTAALHDSQERYRAIVNRAEGIFLADAATKELIECNAALACAARVSAPTKPRGSRCTDFDATRATASTPPSGNSPTASGRCSSTAATGTKTNRSSR